jgi:hypothetical protein
MKEMLKLAICSFVVVFCLVVLVEGRDNNKVGGGIWRSGQYEYCMCPVPSSPDCGCGVNMLSGETEETCIDLYKDESTYSSEDNDYLYFDVDVYTDSLGMRIWDMDTSGSGTKILQLAKSWIVENCVE